MSQSGVSSELRKTGFRKYLQIMITGIRKVFCVLKLYVQTMPVFGSLLFSRNVQILIQNETSTTKDFSPAIQSLCKDISFKCILCNNVEELLEEYPIAVVCQVSNRLEPDIDLAIYGVNCENFAVLLLHTGLEDSLPKVQTVTKMGNILKYHNVKFIDVAFNRDSKLYTCAMNDTATRQLQTFFESFYTKSVSGQRNVVCIKLIFFIYGIYRILCKCRRR